ncbi:MAG: invasin domain 3-containing protein [Armatimonadota bacterium]
MPLLRVSIVLAGLLVLCSASVSAAVMVSVDANTSHIPADGRSYTQILATVLDETGAPVPDGTEVRLTTTAGDVSPAVYTTAGRAIGVLTSSTAPQSATITALCNGAASSTQVEFILVSMEDGQSAADGTISMAGGSLAYCVERDTVVASSGVTLEYKSISIEADSMQVIQGAGRVLAQGNVSIRRGETTLNCNECVLDTRSDRVLIRNFDDKAITTLDVAKLKPIAADSSNIDESIFSQSLDVDGSTWIVSERLTIIPKQKILFFKASVYVRDSKVMTLPYYSYSYKDRQSILQQVRYTSNDGMLIDLPFYCQLSENRASAIKLRYSSGDNESGGYARPRKGPSLGLQHDYLAGRGGYGTFFVDSLGNSNQAYELAHHLEYGSATHSGRADFSSRYQPSSNYARGIHYTTLNVYGSLPKYSYTVLGYYGGSRIKNSFMPGGYMDQSNFSFRTVLRANKSIASTPVGSVFPNLTVGYGVPSGSRSSSLYQSLGLTANRSKRLRGPLSASFAQSAAFTVTADGDTGTEMRFRPSLRTYWMGGSASVGYNLNLRSGLNNTLWSQGRHQIDTNLFFDIGDRLTCSSSFDFGLDSRRMNLFSTASYRAGRLWQIRTNYDLYKYSYNLGPKSLTYSTSYFRIGVFRPVGLYEVGLVWSPDGQQYGAINQGKHLWLELSAAGF